MQQYIIVQMSLVLSENVNYFVQQLLGSIRFPGNVIGTRHEFD